VDLIENNSSNTSCIGSRVFAAEVMMLPSRCPSTARDCAYIHRVRGRIYEICLCRWDVISCHYMLIHTGCVISDHSHIKTKLHGLSPRPNSTERATAACRQSDCQLFADRGCHVVSVTDPYGRILGFLGRSRYFLSSSSSVVLTRLSGPCSRSTTFFLVVPGIEPGPPDL
jgi:hypothetical protein